MKRMLAVTASALAMAVTATPAQAVDMFTDLAAWQTAVGSYNRDTDYGTLFDDLTSLTLDDGTQIDFGSAVNVRQIGDGWATWSGGYTGQVLATSQTSLSGALSPLSGFGFFIEPDPFSLHEFTLQMSDGSSVSASYDGSAGAGFLGFAGGGVTGFTVSSDVFFALGDFYTASGTGAVPEPATWMMLILGFMAVGGVMRSQKRRERLTVRYA